MAAYIGDEEILRFSQALFFYCDVRLMLLSANADPSQETSRGRSALEIAEMSDQDSLSMF